MKKATGRTIPIIDLFAGPGGLGEGFSALQTPDGRHPFKIALSIEKDRYAHQTLTLRSFFRQFAPGPAPEEYYEYLRRADEPEPERRNRLFNAYPEQAFQTVNSALLAELGMDDPQTIRDCIRKALGKYNDLVLLGSPPCRPIPSWAAKEFVDRTGKNLKKSPHYLYQEYIQILATHRPPVFVMENVPGLMSSQANGEGIFEKIPNDFSMPQSAGGAKRVSGRRSPERTVT
ncbi:MAG: hypothetical protein C0407_07125 [Desulfobacca sp.]|nr:hypothetical protein [Desulfobacca sp.]